MNSDNDILLAKWLEGKITPEELQKLQQIYNLELLEQTLKRQEAFEIETVSNETMWKDFEKKIGTQPLQPSSKNRIWFLILVIVLFSLLGSWFYFSNKNNGQEIQTPPAKTETKLYADGTQIHLSPNSKIEYDEAAWLEQRIIQLDGQAYFNVAKGNPFIVKTEQGTVEVLGTQFDIWEMGDMMQVQCYEGSVRVSTGSQSITLSPKQQVLVNKNRLSNVKSIDITQPNWMQQKLVYEKMPLRWVFKDLERFYNKKINTTKVDINDEFSGLIRLKDEISEALNYLNLSDWTYEVKDETIYLLPKKE